MTGISSWDEAAALSLNLKTEITINFWKILIGALRLLRLEALEVKRGTRILVKIPILFISKISIFSQRKIFSVKVVELVLEAHQ